MKARLIKLGTTAAVLTALATTLGAGVKWR
jgi:hypothetical protein